MSAHQKLEVTCRFWLGCETLSTLNYRWNGKRNVGRALQQPKITPVTPGKLKHGFCLLPINPHILFPFVLTSTQFLFLFSLGSSQGMKAWATSVWAFHPYLPYIGLQTAPSSWGVLGYCEICSTPCRWSCITDTRTATGLQPTLSLRYGPGGSNCSSFIFVTDFFILPFFLLELWVANKDIKKCNHIKITKH